MNNKDKAYLLIIDGKSNAEISDELGVSYSSVVSYRKNYEKDEQTGDLQAILSQDHMIVKQIAETLPMEAGQTLEKLEGLSLLEKNVQNSANLILAKLKIVVSNVGADDVRDLAIATDLLCKLQESFFNKKGLNVNVQNNNFDSSTASYGEFLDDKPPINQ